MHVIVVGGGGLIGHCVAQELLSAGHDVTTTYRRVQIPGGKRLDLGDFDALARLMDHTMPDAIVVAAGPSLADVTEIPERARVFLMEMRTAIRALHGSGVLTVVLSSDHVFDGTCGPYLEDEPTWPATDWGRMHQSLEVMASEEIERSLVVRTSDVFGWPRHGKNDLIAIRRRLALMRSVEAAYDRVMTPTHVPNLAAGIRALLEADHTGVAHLAGPMVEESHFLMELARAFALNPHLIRPMSHGLLKYPGVRPQHGGLVMARVADVVDETMFPSVVNALADFARSEPGVDVARTPLLT